jgi:hypothetical protein
MITIQKAYFSKKSNILVVELYNDNISGAPYDSGNFYITLKRKHINIDDFVLYHINDNNDLISFPSTTDSNGFYSVVINLDDILPFVTSDPSFDTKGITNIITTSLVHGSDEISICDLDELYSYRIKLYSIFNDNGIYNKFDKKMTEFTFLEQMIIHSCDMENIDIADIYYKKLLSICGLGFREFSLESINNNR